MHSPHHICRIYVVVYTLYGTGTAVPILYVRTRSIIPVLKSMSMATYVFASYVQ
jgi:hypothetical protein